MRRYGKGLAKTERNQGEYILRETNEEWPAAVTNRQGTGMEIELRIRTGGNCGN